MTTRSVLDSPSYMLMYPRNPEGKPPVNLDKMHTPLKILAQADMIRRFQAGEPIIPIHVRIGITSACNMRCNFCCYHSRNETYFYDCFKYGDKLNTDQTIDFLRDFATNGGRAVTFCGSGECTIHSGYTQISEAANDLGLKIGLITNGTKLINSVLARCIARTHTWVRIGLNAGNADSFQTITHYPSEGFTQILDSIAYLRNHAIEPDFRIGLNYVITSDNYQEMTAAARLAREARAHYIRFEPEFYTALGHDTIENILGEVEQLLLEAKKQESPNFEVSIPKLDRGKMAKTDAVEGDFKKCHYSRFVTALGADGYIYPCPQVHLGSKYRIGNPLQQGYSAWLKSGDREAWEAQNPNREDLCKTCYYRPQNELLEWVLNGSIDLEQILADYERDFPKTLHDLFL